MPITVPLAFLYKNAANYPNKRPYLLLNNLLVWQLRIHKIMKKNYHQEKNSTVVLFSLLKGQTGLHHNKQDGLKLIGPN